MIQPLILPSQQKLLTDASSQSSFSPRHSVIDLRKQCLQRQPFSLSSHISSPSAERKAESVRVRERRSLSTVTENSADLLRWHHDTVVRIFLAFSLSFLSLLASCMSHSSLLFSLVTYTNTFVFFFRRI